MPLSLGANTLVAVVASAAAGTLPGTKTGKYLLTTNTDCMCRFDGDTASKTVFDVFLPAGTALVVQPGSSLPFSFIRDSVDGTAVIHEVL